MDEEKGKVEILVDEPIEGNHINYGTCVENILLAYEPTFEVIPNECQSNGFIYKFDSETKCVTKECQLEEALHADYYDAIFLNSKLQKPMTDVRNMLRDRYFKNDGERVLKTIEETETAMSKLHKLNKAVKKITNDVEEFVGTIESAVNYNDKDKVTKTMKKLEEYLTKNVDTAEM